VRSKGDRCVRSGVVALDDGQPHDAAKLISVSTSARQGFMGTSVSMGSWRSAESMDCGLAWLASLLCYKRTPPRDPWKAGTIHYSQSGTPWRKSPHNDGDGELGRDAEIYEIDMARRSRMSPLVVSPPPLMGMGTKGDRAIGGRRKEINQACGKEIR